MFAYIFKEEYPTDGWLVYDPVEELTRFVSVTDIPWIIHCVCVRACVRVRMHVCVDVGVRVWVCTYVWACMCVYVCLCARMCVRGCGCVNKSQVPQSIVMCIEKQYCCDYRYHSYTIINRDVTVKEFHGGYHMSTRTMDSVKHIHLL